MKKVKKVNIMRHNIALFIHLHQSACDIKCLGRAERLTQQDTHEDTRAEGSVWTKGDRLIYPQIPILCQIQLNVDIFISDPHLY